MFAEVEKIIKAGKAKYKVFEDADVALDQAKSIIQLVKEKQSEKESVLKEIAKAGTELAKTNELIDNAKAEAVQIVDGAKEDAVKIKQEAEATGRTFLGKAVLEADKARQEAHKVKSEADAYVESKKQEATEWENKAQAAKAAHDAYKAALAG